MASLTFGPAARAAEDADLQARIHRHLQAGQELEACRLAQKMANYKGGPAYEKARRELLGRGLSIDDCLTSLTVKRMMKVQNRVERELVLGQDLTKIGEQKDETDAWGTPIRFELVNRPGLLYFIRSAGPDKKYYTPDDAILAGKDREYKKKKSGAAKVKSMWGKGDQVETRSGPGQGSASTAGSAGSEPTDQPGEKVVELEDLLKDND